MTTRAQICTIVFSLFFAVAPVPVTAEAQSNSEARPPQAGSGSPNPAPTAPNPQTPSGREPPSADDDARVGPELPPGFDDGCPDLGRKLELIV
jgi:hypothetical protein